MRSAIDRIFDLIEVIAGRPDGVALAEIARLADLAKPTAHRLLSDLVARGLVRQEANGTYGLTLEIALLGFRHLANIGFLDVCQPELDKLANSAGELIRLSWLDGDRLAFVAESQGAKPGLRFDANLGRQVVFHTMAAGKVFIAQLAPEEALSRVRAQGLIGKWQGGRNSIGTEAELETELARVRRQGFALAYDESEIGTGAVAVPVTAPAGDFLGALAVVVPTARWTREQLGAFAPALRESARAIGEKASIAPFCRKTERRVDRAPGA